MQTKSVAQIRFNSVFDDIHRIDKLEFVRLDTTMKGNYCFREAEMLHKLK